MQVQVQNVAPRATSLDVSEAIADEVQRAARDVSSRYPNYDVGVWKTRTRQNRSVFNAGLTFADGAVATSFLRAHGGIVNPIYVMGAKLRFQASTKPADPHLVQKLRDTPFAHPRVERERQETFKSLASPIPLSGIEFGRWMSVDSVFSPEVEYTSSKSNLHFDGASRSLVVDLTLADVPYKVSAPFSSVSRILSSKDGPPSIILFLTRPPMMQKETPSPAAGSPFDFSDWLGQGDALFGNDTMRPGPRTSSLSRDSRNAKKAALCGTTLRLLFRDSAAFDSFRHRDSQVRLPPIRSLAMKTIPLRLYSSSALSTLQNSMANLDIRVAFQVDLMLHNGLFDAKQLVQLLRDFQNLQVARGAVDAERILALFAAHQTSSWQGHQSDWNDDFELVEEDEKLSARPFAQLGRAATHTVSSDTTTELRKQLAAASDFVIKAGRVRELRNGAMCRHVVITASGLRLEGPFYDQSNSILRRYERPECFIRVSVRDDDLEKYHFDKESDLAAFLSERYEPYFEEALIIGGRQFDFLGFSQSALREHSAWFVCSFRQQGGEVINAASIRRSLGDFSKVIDIPARWMARVAQAFTATQPSITLKPSEFRRIPDIERASRGKTSCFTDGVGTISPELAAEVDAALLQGFSKFQRGQRVKPSCYQVRLGGAKGMLAVDPSLSGRVICLRPSMEKFDAPDSLTLDIAEAFTRPLPAYLNRPLIKILEDLGVPSVTFLRLQRQSVTNIHGAKSSPSQAASLLEQTGMTVSRIPFILRRLSEMGLNGCRDPFVSSCISLAIMHALRDINARILVPGGWTLVGVADESDRLAEGQIYACIKRKGYSSIYLEGAVCISRSPTLHPGDVRMVTAIGKPPAGSSFLVQQSNCVVFSTRGSRSLPSCLAGGDLDGDLYVVYQLGELLPGRTVPPGSYEAPQMVRLDRPCTIEDGAKFFIQYILNDLTGMVATRHLHLADANNSGSESRDCLVLAALHSDAVDFAKTGRSVRKEQLPRSPALRPDFMCPEWRMSKVGKDYYESTRALGELFRQIPLNETKPPSSFDTPFPKAQSLASRRQIEAVLRAQSIDGMVGGRLHPPPPELLKTLSFSVSPFCDDLLRICRLNSLSRRHDRHLREDEAFSGTIAAVSKDRRHRQDTITRLQEQIAALFEATREEIRGEASLDDVQQAERAWAAWLVAGSMDQSLFGIQSFAFIALEVLLTQMAVLNGEL